MNTLDAAQTLRVALRERQRAAGLSDGKMAAMLGVSRPLWCLVANGERPLHFRIAQGAALAYPDLAPLASRVFLTLNVQRRTRMSANKRAAAARAAS